MLDGLFRPRSIVLVGATERSAWSNAAWGNLERFGFAGDVHLVNRKGGTVYQRSAAPSCAALGETVDLALLMVPAPALADALADAGTAGIRHAILLSSGFAEAGDEGRARQEELKARADAAGIRLLGPNCLGFVNYADAVPVWTTPLAPPRHVGRVAIVSQSGATAAMLRGFAQQQGFDPSCVVSTGNEIDLTVADAVAYLAADPATAAIALFIEGVRDPERFAAAALAARDAGKPLIALKIGTSAGTAAAAQAHTDALVGDDRIFDAVCDRFGIVRVPSLEDLIVTADLMATAGPLPGRRIGFLSMSGGVCEIASDRAEAEGLIVPPPADATVDALSQALPGFGHPRNPLDLTGEAINRPQLFENALAILGTDPAFDLIVCFFDAPGAAQSQTFIEAVLAHVARGMARTARPGLLISHTLAPVSPEARVLIERTGLRFVGGGLQLGLAALGRAVAWRGGGERPIVAPASVSSVGVRPASEHDVLAYLATCGVPVIPATLCRSADEAARAAARIGGPAVMKIASPDIAHKSDVGGVDLAIGDAAAARAGFVAMGVRVSARAPGARIDGVLVAPLRRDAGVDLLVGISRDPHWGLALTLALGGVLVELLDDSVTRLLPIEETEVGAMLDRLRGRALLDGYRGRPPVDRAAAAAAIVAICRAAEALGPRLSALEANPLRLSPEGAEALDALAVWSDAAAQS